MVEHEPADERRSGGAWVGRPGPEATTSVVTGRVVSGGRSRPLLLLVVGVAVMLAGLTVVGRLGSDDRRDGVAGNTQRTRPGLLATTPTPTTNVSDTNAGDDIGSVAGPDSVSRTSMAPGEFLLGEPTGLWLFYGGTDPLQRIDLDTGELVDFGIQAYPVLATGGDVVLYQGEAKVSGWVSTAEPGEQALIWKTGPVAPAADDGMVWILDRSRDMEHPSGEPVGSGRWELFDIAANRVVARRPGDRYEQSGSAAAASKPPVGRFEVLSPGPEYSSRPDGVYRYGDDGYRRVGDGRVLTYDDASVLMEDCAGGRCDYSWVGRVGGEPVGDPVANGSVVSAELLAGGRWLQTIDGAGQAQLLDRESGDRLDFDRLASPTVSPDGRWLAWVVGRRGEATVFVTDLASEETVAYRGLATRGSGDLLFVER